MTWYAWTFVGILTFYALLKPLVIGRKRDPLTGSDAVGHIIWTGLLIWAIVALAGNA